ncbi:MAG TPA: type 1 glutamine amidotransferase domain-containing protein [Bacillota bacterium]|nr:type 1 glutamine amidotransferase domain-containing protein [Bacillota bacterium]
MSKEIKVLSLIEQDFEDLELWYPILRLKEEGIVTHLAGEKANEQYVGKYGVPATSEYSFKDINYQEYDGLLVPGGWAPDKLRRYPEVIEIVRYMHDQGRPIGHICHAGWVLASAGILKGKKVTSTPGIKDDLTNAGALWFDDPVVVDGNIVSSRRPPDLPFYMKEFIRVLLQG